MQESNSSIDLNFCDTSFCAFLSTLRLVLILANISGWLRRGLTVWQVTNWSIWAADGRGVRHDLVRGDDRAEVGEDSAGPGCLG